MKKNLNLVYFHCEGVVFTDNNRVISVKSVNLIDFILYISRFVETLTIVSPLIESDISFDLFLADNVNVVTVPPIRKSPMGFIDIYENYNAINTTLKSLKNQPKTLSIGLTFFGTLSSLICFLLFKTHNFIIRGNRFATFFKSSRSLTKKLFGFRIYIYKILMLYLVKRKSHIFFQGDAYINSIRNDLPSKFSDRLFVLNALVSDENIPSIRHHKIYDLIFVGHIQQEKGVFDLIASIKHLRSQNITINLLVVGGGTDVVRFEKEIVGLSNITYVGVCTDRKRLYEYIAQSHFLVLPSYTEGMPRAILEAMVIGTPNYCYKSWRYS